jgi:uncharacterized protein with GYD domain
MQWNRGLVSSESKLKEVNMSKYLICANYVNQGVKGLLKEGGSARREAINKLVESLGGKVECMYYAFGDIDSYVVADMPNNASAASISLAVNATGLAAVKTIVLMTPEEMDEATKKTPDYRPPGV